MADPATRMMARPEEAPQLALALSGVSDIAFARAIAVAVRATPGVADLSPGLMALAATYGPHERVVGVVVRHTSAHDTHETHGTDVEVDVHVIVAIEAAADSVARGDESRATPSGEASDVAVLTQIASRVRAAVYRVASSMNLAPLPTVDVLIDDIELPE